MPKQASVVTVVVVVIVVVVIVVHPAGFRAQPLYSEALNGALAAHAAPARMAALLHGPSMAAPSNMSRMSRTAPTSQLLRFWLNATAL